MPDKSTSESGTPPIQTGVNIWELGNILLHGWKTILTTVAILAGLATLYGILQTPVYRAEGLLLPPSPKDLQTLTLSRIGIGRTDPTEIYDTVRRNFGSRNFQRQFIDEKFSKIIGSTQKFIYSASSPDGFDRKTRDAMSMAVDWNYKNNSYLPQWPFIFPADLRISVTEDINSNRPYLLIRVTWRNPEQAAEAVNQFIRFVNTKTTQQIADETREALAVRKNNLIAYIKHKKTIASENKNDQIAELEENAAIARSLEIEHPVNWLGNNNVLYITPPESFFVDPTKNKNTIIEPPDRQRILPLYQPDPTQYRRETKILSTSIPPLYARGWRALEVEAKYLRNRTNNDPYVIGLRELQQELAWISSIVINEESINVLRMDENAIPPLHPIVNRLWFSLIGIIVGLLIGTFITLVMYATKTRNQSPNLA